MKMYAETISDKLPTISDNLVLWQGNRVFCWGGERKKPGLQHSLIEPSCVGMCTGIFCYCSIPARCVHSKIESLQI